MYSILARNMIYPMADVLMKTSLMKYLREYEKTQWWSRDQLLALQNEKLKALIRHVYQNVPYYQCLFRERGITPRDILTVEDLTKLPILTKDIIRRNFEDLTANDINSRKHLLNSSSGSTGEPLRYYIDMNVVSAAWAGTFRGWQWAGYKLGDKRTTLGGASIVPDKPPSLINRLRWLSERNQPFSAFHMDQEKMAIYAGKIAAYKPKFLRGYPSAIYVFAEYLRRTGINTIRPQAVFTTAEMLLPHHRQAIEKQFECMVFDNYGCYDGGPQACQCSAHHGYHISIDKCILEFVDEFGKPVRADSSGEILTTDLDNYTMPFIRYAVGDRGTPSDKQCPCGRGLPIMSSIQGRVVELFVMKDGNVISGLPLTDVFEHIEQRERGKFKQYQIIQKNVDEIVIKIVKGDNYSEQDASIIVQEFRRHLGEDIKVEMEFLDHIATTKAGKRIFVMSEVNRHVFTT